jgi:hypothetical protein
MNYYADWRAEMITKNEPKIGKDGVARFPYANAFAENFASVLRELRPFKTRGSLRGGPWNNYAASVGVLPSRYISLLGQERPDYAVWSYDTPIAWHTADGKWRVPDVTYSLTTTQHQHGIKQAVELITDGAYVTGPRISLMIGKGHSPFGPRSGGF